MRRLLAVALLVGLLSGCADTSYYAQSVRGHMALMAAAKPVDAWLQDPAVPQATKDRLALAQRIRDFAVHDLGLPDNPSYRRYADLQRRAAVWNVVAAPEYALQLKTWCFPVLGCVGYRGYFDEAAARTEAQTQRAQGLDAAVYGVPAYSTLGWMNWAGGDPLLNTFLAYPEGEMARLLVHELAHQKLYARDDTAFNESFATAVERIGGARWLERHASEAARREYAAFDNRRADFRALTRATRKALAEVYDPQAPWAGDSVALRTHKAAVMDGLRARYAELRTQWGILPGQNAPYDRWVADANNATLGAQGAYDDLVPAFEALFTQLCATQDAGQGDCSDASRSDTWARFYDAVARLAALPKAERQTRLDALSRQ
jgi:predicted aminopeptidase